MKHLHYYHVYLNPLVDAKDDLQSSFLKIWTDLSQAFQYENLFAILDFVLKKVEEQKLLISTFKTAIMPTVKNIFFAIYEPVLNRAVMTVYIVRIILTVLKIGAEDYRQQGLIVKQRAAEILTTLQAKLSKQENDSVAFGGIHYDIHHEILQHVHGKKSISSTSSASAASSPSGSQSSRNIGRKRNGHHDHSSITSLPRYRATNPPHLQTQHLQKQNNNKEVVHQ